MHDETPDAKAARLKVDASADDRRADEMRERDPDTSYADYLERRAAWRRKLARDAEQD